MQRQLDQSSQDHKGKGSREEGFSGTYKAGWPGAEHPGVVAPLTDPWVCGHLHKMLNYLHVTEPDKAAHQRSCNVRDGAGTQIPVSRSSTQTPSSPGCFSSKAAAWLTVTCELTLCVLCLFSLSVSFSPSFPREAIR